jgi:hypothetical protein
MTRFYWLVIIFHKWVLLQMNDTAAPTLFDVPCQFDQWYMGCRRSEEEPINVLP